jgi:hypothetical protein
MNINITSITIIERKNFSDTVVLHTTLPGAVWPYDEPNCMRFEAAKGSGVKYCDFNFHGIPVTVIQG